MLRYETGWETGETRVEGSVADIPDPVPVSGDWSSVRTLDFSHLRGSPVSLYVSDMYELGPELAIIGSSAGDRLDLGGLSDATISAGAGADTVNAGAGNDLIDAGAGSDVIRASAGNDTILAGVGHDTIDGGAGQDTLLLDGNRADYRLSVVRGNHVVTDLRTGGTGAEIIGNIETLRFADQIVTLAEIPSRLHASVSNGTLGVAGPAAVRDGAPVSLHLSYWDRGDGSDDIQADLTDNNLFGTPVDISGLLSQLRALDLSGVRGAGARVTIDDIFGSGPDLTLIGTDRADQLDIRIAGGATVRSGGGADRIWTSGGNDLIDAGAGSDHVSAAGGDDTIVATIAHDTIDGGDGHDTLVLTGNRDDYLLRRVEGNHVVTDLRAGGTGAEIIGNIEALRFADGTVALDLPATRLHAQRAGGFLTVSGAAAVTPLAEQVAVTLDYATGRDGRIEAAIRVTDSNLFHSDIPVTGDQQLVGVLDFSGLRRAGVNLTVNDFQQIGPSLAVVGSQADDKFGLAGAGDASVHAKGGDDAIFTGAGNDTVDGGDGNDFIDSGDGDDFLTASAGRDVFIAGNGHDTIIFRFDQACYRTQGDDGIITITAIADDSVSMTASGVETLWFADGSVELDPLMA